MTPTALRRALYGPMAADTTLTAMLGPAAPGYTWAIYHQQAPELASYPFVIIQKQSGIPIDARGMGRVATTTVLDVDVWTIKGVDQNTTADRVEGIAARLVALLTDYNLSIAGATPRYCRKQSDIQYPEVSDGEMYQHCGALFRIETVTP